MAQINLTLNQEEILELLTNDREGAFKLLLQESLNSILKAESSSQLGAENTSVRRNALIPATALAPANSILELGHWNSRFQDIVMFLFELLFLTTIAAVRLP